MPWATFFLTQSVVLLAKLVLTLRTSEWDQQEYAQPQQNYAQPQQEYAQPQQNYAQPQQEYSQPQNYAQPRQEYSQPQPTYDAWNDMPTPANNGTTGYSHSKSSWVLQRRWDGWV